MSYKRIEEFYKNNRRKLVQIFSRRCGGRDNAEDIIQEGFYRALRYSDSLSKERDIGPWIRRILNNALRDAQKEHRMQGMSLSYDEEMHQSGDLSEFDRERVDEVKRAIASKRPDTRHLLELYYYHNYTPRDVVKVTDHNNQAVRIAIWRFKKQMKG